MVAAYMFSALYDIGRHSVRRFGGLPYVGKFVLFEFEVSGPA